MKIAVNTRFLIKDKLEGIGRFTYETLKAMVERHPEHEFIFLFDRDYDKDFLFASNVTGMKLFPPARHPFLFVWFFEFSIYNALKTVKPDVFLSCDGFLCLRSKTPQVAVIHDLAFEHYPEDVSFWARMYYKFFFPRFARKAAAICTVSEFSKSDIVEKYQVNSSGIHVVYNGASNLFRPAQEDEKQNIKQKFTNGENYFVYVGALQPRKNISRMLQAFDRFKQEGNPGKLMVVGRMAWKTRDIEETFSSMNYKNDVVFTGRISDNELASVLGSAVALVYVPYLEGFGIPILEAMQCGTPVITSNITAMPEVCGDAGILVNPYDIIEISTAMKEICSNENLRSDLSAKAIIQAQKFNWTKTADAVWETIVSCATPKLFS